MWWEGSDWQFPSAFLLILQPGDIICHFSLSEIGRKCRKSLPDPNILVFRVETKPRAVIESISCRDTQNHKSFANLRSPTTVHPVQTSDWANTVSAGAPAKHQCVEELKDDVQATCTKHCRQSTTK